MSKTIVALIIACLLGAFRIPAVAQSTLPPLPVESTHVLLLPDALYGGFISEDPEAYLLLADAGETLILRMERAHGDLIPALTLTTLESELVAYTAASDLAGRVAEIEHSFTEAGWYVVLAGRDEESAPNSAGAYLLQATGTSSSLYQFFDLPALPQKDRATLSLGGYFTDDAPLALWLPIPENSSLAIEDSRNSAIHLESMDGVSLSLDTAQRYFSTGAEWVLLTVEPEGDGVFALNLVLHLANAPDGIRLQALITATPSQTFTPSSTPTLTLTASWTPRPSNTLRPSNTFTPSPTLTASPTLLPTSVPSETFTPSHTPTNPPKPTSTPRPPDTPTPAPSPTTPAHCPGVLVSRMVIGEAGRVTPGDPNRLRRTPSLSGEQIGRIPGGSTFVVLAGPICADGFAWWEVNYNGQVGWTAEGDADSYWLEPLQGR